MKQNPNKMKAGMLRILTLWVLPVFFINMLAIPVLTTRGMAAAAGAGAAGASGGAATDSGLTTDTIAASVVITAVAAIVLISGGGEDQVAAAVPLPNDWASKTADALRTLDTTQLGQLATANAALGNAGQTTLASNASSMTPAQFAAYLAGGGGYAVESPQYTALTGIYSSYTPAQLQALQNMYASAVEGGTVNQGTLKAIADVISTTASGTPAQQAENLRLAILAILTARHPGATIIVTVTHLGNNVYTTSSHVR